MKTILFILALFLIDITSAFSQDLIVKSNGDSLNCKIVYIESEFIHFTYKDEKNDMRASMLPVKQVVFHKKKFLYHFRHFAKPGIK